MEKKNNELTSKDIKLFKQLAKTGVSDVHQAKKFIKLSIKRIKQLEDLKYIKTRKYRSPEIITTAIKLDNKGKSFCKHRLFFPYLASSQINHLYHDILLTYAYNSLSEEIQDTWEHGKEIIKDIYEKNPKIDKKYLNDKGKLLTSIDARVTVGDVTTGIEVLSKRGFKAERELKRDIAINLAGCNGGVKFIKQ
jgi:hypothetical protein